MFIPHDPRARYVYVNAAQSLLLPLQPNLLHPLSSYSPSAEHHTLESSIRRVVHHDGQQDAADDGTSSAVTTVTREILQEAAEHIRAALGETLRGEGGAGAPLGE